MSGDQVRTILGGVIATDDVRYWRVTDGVIGRPAFRSLEILGAALQADDEYEVRGCGQRWILARDGLSSNDP
jgi:hypothetical protein